MKSERREVINMLFLILQIGIAMIAAVVVGGLLGFFCGKWLGAKWMILPGIGLGVVAGYQNVYRMVRKYTRPPKEEPKEDKEAAERRRHAEEEFLKWKEEKNNK